MFDFWHYRFAYNPSFVSNLIFFNYESLSYVILKNISNQICQKLSLIYCSFFVTWPTFFTFQNNCSILSSAQDWLYFDYCPGQYLCLSKNFSRSLENTCRSTHCRQVDWVIKLWVFSYHYHLEQTSLTYRQLQPSLSCYTVMFLSWGHSLLVKMIGQKKKRKPKEKSQLDDVPPHLRFNLQ